MFFLTAHSMTALQKVMQVRCVWSEGYCFAHDSGCTASSSAR